MTKIKYLTPLEKHPFCLGKDLMFHSNFLTGFAMLFFILLLITPGYGLVVRAGQSVDVFADEVIDDDLIAFGRQVNIKGKVNGDVFAFAQVVFVNGEISGSIFGAGSSADITVKNAKTVWAAGGNIHISGPIKNNALVFGGSLFIDKNAKINKDLIAFGGQFDMAGEVTGRISGGVGNFIMNGKSGDVDIQAEKIQVTSQAEIGGDFIIRGKNAPVIAEGAKIIGETKFIKSEKETKPVCVFSFIKIIMLIAAIVVGLVIIALSARHTRRIMEMLTRAPWKSLGFGFLSVIVIPIAVVILLITLIGFPIALWGSFVYLVLLYLSSIFVGLVVGEQIIRLFKKEGEISLYLSLIVGMLVLFFLGLVPVLGFIVKIVVLLFGVGMIVLGQWSLIKDAKEKILI